MPQGYVAFDLAAMFGSARFRSTGSLSRRDKMALELWLATNLLSAIAQNESLFIEGITSNPNDPPDIYFDLLGQRHGVELTELLPERRLERDAAVQRAKEDIISQLPVGELTRDWVISISLQSEFKARLRLDFANQLAGEITGTLRGLGPRREPTIVPLPIELRSVLHSVHLHPTDLTDDPRLSARDSPLVVFSAQHTFIVPDRDFPRMIERCMKRKAFVSLAVPTWLLMWSSHYALPPGHGELVHYMDLFVQQNELPYERIFYLDIHQPPKLTEITRNSGT